MKNLFGRYKWEFASFSVYLILALIFTWPVILHFKNYIYGTIGDPFYNLWLFHNLGGEILQVNIPFGLEKAGHILVPQYPILDLLSKLLTNLFSSDIAASNFIILISFPLAGLAVYLIIKEITNNRLAAFFAGLAFAFSPFHLARAEIHINLVSIYWLPFFLYFLIKTLKSSTVLNWIMTGVLFAITLLDHYQYGILALIVFVIFCIFILIRREKKRLFFQKVLIGIVSGSVVLAILAPWIFSFKVEEYNRTFAYHELSVYSARFFNYFLPSPENPLFGKFTKPIYEKSIKETGSNLTEQTLYLGIIPLCLVLYALWCLIRKKSYILPLKNYIYFFIILGLVGFYFSFAPTMEIFGLTIKTPAYWIFPHLPVFRVYARFGLLVILAVSVLAGISFSFIVDKIKSQKVSLFLCFSVSLFLLIEFLNFPPFHYIDVSEKAMPQVYQWLKKQPKGIVAEYPLLPSEEPKSYDYLLWQRYHKMPLVYGAPVNSEGDNFRKTILNPQKPETINRLKQIGVEYVIIHQERYTAQNAEKYPAEYNNGEVPKIDSENLELLGKFDRDMVYRIK